MRIHCIQHAPFEGLGYIGVWLLHKSYTVTYTNAWENPIFPDVDNIDGLIVMGGPMSVHDEKKLAWLSAEKRFILDCINKGKRIIGICLGSQLIAECLGARISRNIYKEIGWHDVEIKPSLSKWLQNNTPLSLQTFHWHGETFSIPENAVCHASSKGCDNQLFTYGDRIAAIQFHPEVTAENSSSMLNNCSDELTEQGPFIQTVAEIENTGHNYNANHEFLQLILEKVFG